MKNHLRLLSLTFCIVQILLSFNPTIVKADQSIDGNIYVWEFATRDGERNDYTRSLTEEFEEALIQAECCEVLQRRLYARLFDQKQSEKAIMKLDGAPEVVINNLRSLEAEIVVFGEMYDDTNSGQVKITVNFESFEGRIIKKASAYLAKFELANPSIREQTIENILSELDISPTSGKVLEIKTIDDWEFTLTGCYRSGSDVTCGYKVKSNNRDRSFTIYADAGGVYSGAQDEFSYDYKVSEVKLANQNHSAYISNKYLVADIEATGNIKFSNIAARSTKFVILYVTVEGTDLQRQSIQFRDIKFQ